MQRSIFVSLCLHGLVIFSIAACKKGTFGAMLSKVSSESETLDEMCQKGGRVDRRSAIQFSQSQVLVVLDPNPCGFFAQKNAQRISESKSGKAASLGGVGVLDGLDRLTGENVPGSTDPVKVNLPSDFGYNPSAAELKKPVFVFASSEITDPNIVEGDQAVKEEARRQGYRIIDLSGMSPAKLESEMVYLRKREPTIFSRQRGLIYIGAHGAVQSLGNGSVGHVTSTQTEHVVGETGQIETYQGVDPTVERISAINRGLGASGGKKQVIFNSSCFSGQLGADLGPNYRGPPVVNASSRNQVSGSGEVFELMRMMDPQYAKKTVGSRNGGVTPQQFVDYLNRPENQLGNVKKITTATEYFTDYSDVANSNYNQANGIVSDTPSIDVTSDRRQYYQGNSEADEGYSASIINLPNGQQVAPVYREVATVTPQRLEIVGNSKDTFLIAPGRQAGAMSSDIPHGPTLQEGINSGAQRVEAFPGSGSAARASRDAADEADDQ